MYRQHTNRIDPEFVRRTDTKVRYQSGIHCVGMPEICTVFVLSLDCQFKKMNYISDFRHSNFAA